MPAHKLNTRLVKIRADSLRIHPHAQRSLVASQLKYLTSKMDLDALGTLHAIEGKHIGEPALLIIDGQHRWQALMNLGFGEWIVDVQVYAGIDDLRASHLFLELNHRSPVSTFAKFDQARKSGDETAIGVEKIVHKHNLRIGHVPRDGEIACVNRLAKVYLFNDGESLDSTLGCLGAAFGTVAASLDGSVVEGLGLIFHEFNGIVDSDLLANKLSKYPGGAKGLIGSARGLMEYRKSSLASCMKECVIDAYNSGRRKGRLSPAKTKERASTKHKT